MEMPWQENSPLFPLSHRPIEPDCPPSIVLVAVSLSLVILQSFRPGGTTQTSYIISRSLILLNSFSTILRCAPTTDQANTGHLKSHQSFTCSTNLFLSVTPSITAHSSLRRLRALVSQPRAPHTTQPRASRSREPIFARIHPNSFHVFPPCLLRDGAIPQNIFTRVTGFSTRRPGW